jgi:hypothetical protein
LHLVRIRALEFLLHLQRWSAWSKGLNMSFSQSQIDAALDASCMTTIDFQVFLNELLKINSDQTAAFPELFFLLMTIVKSLNSDVPLDQRWMLLTSHIQQISQAQKE